MVQKVILCYWADIPGARDGLKTGKGQYDPPIEWARPDKLPGLQWVQTLPGVISLFFSLSNMNGIDIQKQVKLHLLSQISAVNRIIRSGNKRSLFRVKPQRQLRYLV